MRTWMLLAALAGCSSTEIQIVFEAEDGPYDYDWTPRPVGAGLVSNVGVFKVDWESGYDDPDISSYSRDALTWTVDGGETVDCNGLCVRATSNQLSLDVETPDGTASAARDVATDIRIAAFTPRWGHVTVDALHVEVGTAVALHPVFRAAADGVVSGHADLEASGPITFADGMITATDAGAAALFAPSLPDVPPLEIRAITREASSASIASFTIDRMFYDHPLAELTLYTESPAYINSFVIEAFDSDGALALAGLEVAASGPHLSPGGLTDGACITEEYCFLHPSLPDGVDAADSWLDLSAGSATARIPVHIVRAAY